MSSATNHEYEDGSERSDSEDGTVMHSLYLALAMAYVFYYLFYVVKKPVVSCNPKFNGFLERHCPVLSENFWPTIWCVEARVQTIARQLLQSRPVVQYEREMIATADGGQFALDWVYNESSTQYSATKPVVIILPGLIGTSNEKYALHLVSESTKLGFRSVVFNYRGNGGAELKTPRTYNATNTEDLSFVISHIKTKFPGSPVFAMGVSLGGVILTNYVAKTGQDSGLVGAMTVSSPWNVFESSKSLEEPINLFCFNRMLCRQLKEAVFKYEHLFKDKVDLKALNDCITIREFDEQFTSKLFGYKTNEDYYRDACTHEKVQDIKVPFLALNAADDPFSPGQFIPVDDARKSSRVAIVTTSRGGHIGFMDGCIIPSSVGYVQRVFGQFSKAIYDHGEELTDWKN